MEQSMLWSASETNKYLYRQLRTLAETHGFVVSPKQSKTLIRIREHHIQMIWVEIAYGATDFNMLVAPTASFSEALFARGRITPRRSNDDAQQYNWYTRLAIPDKVSAKKLYRAEELQKTWEAVIGPQAEREIFAYFDAFDFAKFAWLTQNHKDGVLSLCLNPGNADALQFLAMAHNAIWMGNYGETIPLLKQVIAGEEKWLRNSVEFGFDDPKDTVSHLKDHDAAKDLVTIIEGKANGWEAALVDKLRQLEKDAAELVYGVAIDENGKTIRVKKKQKTSQLVKKGKEVAINGKS